MNENDKINIKPLNEVIKDTDPEPEPIISNGILPRKSLLLITGKEKARKSFLAQNLAIAISAGYSFACFKINSQEKVLYLSAEGGYHANRERFKKMMNNFVNDNQENVFLSAPTRINLGDNGDYELIRTKISEYNPGVVIIDPLVKFHNANENATNEMMNVLNKIRDLIEEFSISIILIHHLGKDVTKGARGSSCILGEYDSSINISKKGISHILEIELRHANSPGKVQIEFDANTFWFKSINQSQLVLLIKKDGDLKKDIVERAISNKLYLTQGGVYKALKKNIEKGLIREQGDILYPGNFL